MRLARLDVLVVGADIADVRESEGDDLLGVARVGHHFLIARHGGVEAQFPDRLAFGAEALAPHRPPVGEHDDSRRALGSEARAEVVRRPWAEEPSVRGFRRCR